LSVTQKFGLPAIDPVAAASMTVLPEPAIVPDVHENASVTSSSPAPDRVPPSSVS
jgi:hypothetical protein